MKSWARCGATLAATVALCAGPGAVWAQASAPSPAGRAKAEGDTLLAAAKAGDLFDNLTTGDGVGIKLKHRASGLICEFNAGFATNSVIVFDSAQRGDEIACSTGGPAGDRTLYATRAPGRTLDQAFAHDLAEVKRSHPGAQDYDLPRAAVDGPILSLLERPPMPLSRTARFIADHTFTSVSSAMVGDWSLEFRYTCPEERQDLAAAILQPTLWVATLAQIAKVPINLVDPKQAV
ncbi:MAG: hypothetical protein JWO72_2314 [Caulobacteraceae bacterium]|nr:hypothetical protein [Caulobacteraceae bacterium]